MQTLHPHWFYGYSAINKKKRERKFDQANKIIEKLLRARDAGKENEEEQAKWKKELGNISVPYVFDIHKEKSKPAKDEHKTKGWKEAKFDVDEFTFKLADETSVSMADLKTMEVVIPPEYSTKTYVETYSPAESGEQSKPTIFDKNNLAENMKDFKAGVKAKLEALKGVDLSKVKEYYSGKLGCGEKRHSLDNKMESTFKRMSDHLDLFTYQFQNLEENLIGSKISIRICAHAEKLFGKNMVKVRPDLGKHYGNNILYDVENGFSSYYDTITAPVKPFEFSELSAEKDPALFA